MKDVGSDGPTSVEATGTWGEQGSAAGLGARRTALLSSAAFIRWQLFAGLWGWALLMHQATFDRWPHSPLGWALCCCGVALALWPERFWLLPLSFGVDLAYLLQGLPEVANHLFFEALCCTTWLIMVVGYAYVTRQRGLAWRRVWFGDAGPQHPLAPSQWAVRIGVGLVYWLSVLHKLNWDFLDPEVSCATYMYRRVRESIPILPDAPWVGSTVIAGTLVGEVIVPVLLVLRRTWRVGLVSALVFHLALSLDPTPGIYSFTGLLYAMFILLVPEAAVAQAGRLVTGLERHWGHARLWRVRLLGVGVWALILLYGATRDDRWSLRAGFPVFVIWCAIVGAGYIALLRASEDPREPASERGSPVLSHRLSFQARWPAFAAWLLPCAVLLTGLAPYLGLRTQLSFSMFSNLRVEADRSNHVFMPRLLTLAPYQDDLVEVLGSNEPSLEQLQDQQLLLPYFELRHRVSSLASTAPLELRYLHGGQTLSCEAGECLDGQLRQPVSRAMRALFYFRPVDKGEHMRCRH